MYTKSLYVIIFCSLFNSIVYAVPSAPLSELGEPAANYAKQLTQDQTANFDTDERAQLRASVDLLLERGHCNLALPIAKQIISGITMIPTTGDWARISRAASCSDGAESKKDAVMAAWLSFNMAVTNNQRRDTLLLLGAALENNSQYGYSYALAAYRDTLEYGASKPVRDKIAALEQKIAALEQIAAAEQVLQLERFYIPTEDSNQPSICLDFSANIPHPNDQSYGEFIRFEPQFTASFRYRSEDEICVEGAVFGANYQMSILPELVAINGNKTAHLVQYQVQTGNRPAKLWFDNSRYVLPVGGGVPIHGINVSKANLALYRIEERNLLDEDVRNVFRTDIYKWKAENIQDNLGERVWSGEADLNINLNQDAITNLPLTEYTPPTPGVYILTATPKTSNPTSENSYEEIATLWLLVSDVGITSYQGTNGMTLVTRSLATSKPLNGIVLKLYARNNRILAETVSDAQGIAKFSKTALEGNGGREPLIVEAYSSKGDFNFMDISVSPFDLSDRGVAGRTTGGAVEAFLYTERGVYRPGESVFLTALVRDDRGVALDSGLPLTLRIMRSDEQIVTEQVVEQKGGGGYSFTFQLSKTARAGRWKTDAFLDTKAPSVGTVNFIVEDIVPPRIEVTVVKTPTIPMKPGDFGQFEIQAQYLFGAAAADLAAAATMRITADPHPFPQLSNYRFGLIDEIDDSTLEDLETTHTNDTGNAEFNIKIDKLPKLERPLLAQVRAEVVDVDGRAVATTYDVPVRHKPSYIGILVPGENGYVPEHSATQFQIMAVDPIGKPLPLTNLQFKLIEETTDYQWYREEGTWKFKAKVLDSILKEGVITTTETNNPSMIAVPEIAGNYRLEVRQPDSGVASSARIAVGWAGGEAVASTPDRLTVTAERKDYRPGEVAKLRVKAPFTGTMSLVLAANDVVSVQNLDLPANEQTVEIPVTADWAGGVYALVTAYRPDAGSVGHGPRRAVGVTWLGLAQNLHEIPLQLEVPVQTRPRQTLQVAIKADLVAANDSVFATVAAVDEGVLQLTAYPNPHPLNFYFGQRTLGVNLRDLYGQLIDGHQGTAGQIRSGGDDNTRRGTPDSNIQIVSLFSGIVPLDNKGQAVVPLQIPDFNGKLRLVAVAWSKHKVGQATTPLTVRDKVVLLPSVPRFLAIGDRSRMNVTIHNVEGEIGNYRLHWSTDEILSVLEPGPTEVTMPLAPGERRVLNVGLGARSAGNGTLRLRLTAPNGEVLEREVKIGVRPPFLPERQTRFGRLRPGASTRFGRAMVENLRPETVTGVLSVSTMPALNVPGLLRELDMYPHGCLEQVVSRAFPLLYAQRLGERWEYKSETAVAERLLSAMTQILEKQQENGSFSLWNSDGEEDAWVSAYTLDFVQRAKANGVEVPDLLWNRGLEWLRQQVATPEIENFQTLAVQTYSLYLLAQHGDMPIETARYLLDKMREQLPSALSAYQLGAALAFMGDTDRATQAFIVARNLNRNEELNDYGSKLRDLAALLLIANETGQDGSELVQILAQELKDNQLLSTQEQAWIIRAANSLTEDPALLAIKIQGITIPARPISITRDIPVSILAEGLNLANAGESSAWYSLNVEGSPMDAPLSMTQGLYVQRSLLSLSGEPVDMKVLPPGKLMVVLLEGNTTVNDVKHRALLLDPLPAGLEIENSNLANAASATNLEWLGQLTSTSYIAALDDRFVAAFNLDSSNKTFKLAYLARAVSPGRYRAPPPWIEDMYRPRYRGRGKSGWVEIMQ